MHVSDHAVFERRSKRLINRRLAEPSIDKQQYRLCDLLDRIESKILALRRLLLTFALGKEDASIHALIRAIRDDERQIMECCVHRINQIDPMASVEHDLTNNDYTFSLYEKLAIAAEYGLRRRVMFLHRLQRDICRALSDLGIETSQN